MSFVCVCNERDLMTDGIKVQASARAPSDGAFGVLIEPLQQMGRVASVSTILTPQKPPSTHHHHRRMLRQHLLQIPARMAGGVLCNLLRRARHHDLAALGSQVDDQTVRA